MIFESHTRRRVTRTVLATTMGALLNRGTAPGQELTSNRFVLLFIAHLLSCVGTWMYRLAFPLLILHLTGSALHAAALYALEYLPFLVLSLPGGILADRCNRRALLIICNSSVAAVAAAIGLAVYGGGMHLIALYSAALVMACADPLYHPAFQALLPRVVDEKRLDRANSMVQGGENLITLVGPVLAGGLVISLGYGTPILASAGLFALSAVVICAVRKIDDRSSADPIRETVALEIRTGFTYLTRQNPALLAGSLLFTGTNFGIWLIQANLMYYLTFYRSLTPSQVGFFLAIQGSGALLGATAAPYLLRRVSTSLTIIRCTVVGGLVTILLLFARDLLSISLIFAMLSALSSVNVVAWFTLRQRIVPLHLLGRTVAITRMLAFSVIPLAALLSGTIEDVLHNIYVLFAAGGLFRLIIGIIAWYSPLGRKVDSC